MAGACDDDGVTNGDVQLNQEQFNILCGNFQLSALPSIKPRQIRLFICAPYDDTEEEVSKLHKDVFPRLREFSMSRYGLEFQTVDLNWGVHKQSNLNNEREDILELFEKELDKCQDFSIGMTFFAIIGDDIGQDLLPRWIERKHFEIIKDCLSAINKDINDLEEHYKLNINYLSNRYELSNVENMTHTVENNLLCLLATGTNEAIGKSMLTKDSLKILNKSVLEFLVTRGLYNKNDKNDKIFSFVRLLQSAKGSEKLNKLKDTDICYHIPAEQVYRLKVDKQNDAYLKNLEGYYYNKFEELIEKFVRQNTEMKSVDAYQDALYHLHYIKSNDSNFLTETTECIMKALRDYIFEDTTNQPLVLIGPTGSGKTSYLSNLASNMYLHFIANETTSIGVTENSLVIRFIGIDGKSFYLRNLLKSLCQQLNLISNRRKSRNIINTSVPEKLVELKMLFRNFLTEYKKHKLVLILDSLENLYPQDNAYKLDWLPKYLSSNCRLILSVTTESDELIRRLRRKYINETSFITINGLNKEQVELMVQKKLRLNSYRLESSQLDSIRTFLERNKTIYPLHFKMLSEQFLTWKSSYAVEECVLKETLNLSVQYFLKSLETRFNKTLVKHVLCYITITKNGISELELQDVLSLDNDLMIALLSKDIVKQSGNAVRVPWLYISQILAALRSQLITRPFHGVYTIYWRHKIFKQIVFQKYLGTESDLLFFESMNRNLAHYFLGKWAHKEKPVSYDRIELPTSQGNSSSRLTFDKPIIRRMDLSLDRLVPSQPLKYKDFHIYIKPRLNTRKLSILPFHLMKANMTKELESEIFLNVKWIYSKLVAFDIQQVLYDYDMYKVNSEINIVCDCLKMSEPNIAENAKLLFNELSGRLLPFYNIHPNLKALVDQCDEMALKLNPVIPIGPTFDSPSWIVEKNIDLGLKMNDPLFFCVLESDFNGRILAAKNMTEKVTKFFDLDLLESMNNVNTGEGQIYCSKNGEFVCSVEKHNKFTIKRVETDDLYGIIDLDSNEIGQITVSTNFVSINFRKAPSPLLIDLNQSKIIELFPYQTSFSCISSDEKVILIHSEKHLNYHLMSTFQRKMTLDSFEIPETAVMIDNNKKIFVLFKDTKQILHYTINLDKNIYQSKYILQDRDIKEMKATCNESFLLIRSSQCIYVVDTLTLGVVHKLKTSDMSRFNNTILSSKEVFNGFGCTLDNNIIYATLYTFLVCYSMETGSIIRIFQSNLSANRIVKSYSCLHTDTVLSLLDNGHIIQWNLSTLSKNEIEFDDMKVFNSPVVDCSLPLASFDSSKNMNHVVSYCSTSPDVKCNRLRTSFSAKNSLRSYDPDIDDPLTTHIKLCTMDENGRFCFIKNEIHDFAGKQLPSENDFVKINCTVLDLMQDSQVIEQFTYIVRKDSRFEIQAKFFSKNHRSNTNNTQRVTYLMLKIVSCINDFDPYCTNPLDWTEFETNIKLYEIPHLSPSTLNLVTEFKMFGEALTSDVILTKGNTFVALMHECHKLRDKLDPSIVKAKRYECHLNLFELFDQQQLKLFSLNEFLTLEQFNHQNVFLHVLCLLDNKLLLIYSKQGAQVFIDGQKNASNSEYEYDYKRFRFMRNICTEKSGVILDAETSKISSYIPSLFTKFTNVETLIGSNSWFVLDNNWNLYDMKKGGEILYRYGNLGMNFKWTRFVFDGAYLLTTNTLGNKLFLIRCYDSFVCASFVLGDKISCIKIGELDRTIVLGNESGYLLTLKLLIDLEYNEAKKMIKFCRSSPVDRHSSFSRSDSLITLNSDIRRVIHSAHAHRQLKSRESRASSMKIVLDRSEFLKESSILSHSEFNKTNLSKLSGGIKHFNGGGITTRACNIQ